MIIHLHGSLKKYGGPYDWQCHTIREAIDALKANFPPILQTILEGQFKFIRGDLKTGLVLTEKMLSMRLGNSALHIVPQVAGAGGGTGKAILGAVIVVAAIALAPETGGTSLAGASAAEGAAGGAAVAGGLGASIGVLGLTYGNIAFFGAAMALSGVGQLLSPTNAGVSGSSAAARPSYMFNGPLNVNEQGGPVPLAIGRVLAGTVTVSSGMVRVNTNPQTSVAAPPTLSVGT